MANVEFIAHRGFHDGVPENSMASFVKAAERGVSIELDVRLSADGEVAVFHDATLSKACGVKGRFSDRTYQELLEYRLSGTSERIPLLSDVLKIVDGRVPVYIEIKNERKGERIEPILSEIVSGYDGKCAVQSFDHRPIVWFRRHAPKVDRGMIYSSDIFIAWFNFLTRPGFISVSAGIDVRVLRYLRERMRVLAWTVKDKAALDNASRFFSGVVFDGFDPATGIPFSSV